MQYEKLGRSGLVVSRLCLGTMMFGGRTDEAEAARIIAHAREAGVNYIDSADMYNKGLSEEIVGRALKNDRHRWVLATKVANTWSPWPNEGGLSRRWIIEACDNSLRRLGADHIDIYYLHKEDHATDLAETVRAVADLIRAGKIRYFGVSNYRAWRIAEICRLCDEAGIDRPVVCQPYYNAFNRQPEVEVLPACGHYGIGVTSYSPVARGVLTGKYAPDREPPPGSRAAASEAHGHDTRRMRETEWRPESLALAQQVRRHAEALGITTAQFATAWVLANRLVTSVIAGPRTLEQWTDYLPALDYRFTREDEAFVDGLVAPGHPSSPGYNDPAYPVEGRIPRPA